MPWDLFVILPQRSRSHLYQKVTREPGPQRQTEHIRHEGWLINNLLSYQALGSKVITWSFLINTHLINTHLCPISVPYPRTTCLHRVLSCARFNNDLWNPGPLRTKMWVTHHVRPLHVKPSPWCTGRLPLELLHSFLFSEACATGTSSLSLHDTVV